MKANLSRRQFLAQSATFAGASMGIAARGADGAAPLRLGFVGLGDRGLRLLRTTLDMVREGVPCYVTALCDIDPAKLRRGLDFVTRGSAEVTVPPKQGDEAARPRGFTHYRALVDAGDVDAVFVATPVYQHADQVLTLLAAGKHVYCEKPLSADLEDGARVLRAATEAESTGQVFQVGLQRRFNPRYRASVEFLRRGEAGKIHFVRAQWHTNGSGNKTKPWLFRAEKSGDMILEQASHQFDVFNWLFGSLPLAACGMGGIHHFRGEPHGRDTMDHYGVVLEYPGGAKVQLSHISFAVPERRFAGISELVFAEHMGVDLGAALAWNRAGETVRLKVPRGADTQTALVDFVRAAGAGAPSTVNARVGYEATVTALLCRRAIETGRTVRLEELGEFARA